MRFIIVSSATLLLTFTLNSAYALPSTEAVQGVINLCAGGRSVEVQANLNASLQKWLSGASGKGNAKISDIGAIIKLTKDDKIRVEALSVYHSCLKTMIPMFMSQEAKEKKTEKKSEGGNTFTITGNNINVNDVHVGNK